MKKLAVVYVLAWLVSILTLLFGFGLVLYSIQHPEEVVVYRDVVITQKSYFIITATPQPTEIVQFAPYQPTQPIETLLVPTEVVLPTPTPKCVDAVKIVKEPVGKLLTVKSAEFQATIQNSGTCVWKNYRLIALNAAIDLPIGLTYPQDMIDVKIGLNNAPTGSINLKILVVNDEGSLVLFENSPDGLMQMNITIPQQATRFKEYPLGNGKGIFCVGGS